jgi:VWFA-related protein
MSLRLRATFFLFALTVVPLCSQEQSVPSFKAETRIVLVDLVVTDGKGNAVPNLEKSDVLVFENGAPQTISFFEEHKSTPTAPVKSPWMPPHIFSNFQPVQLPDSVNVLVLDWLNTQPQDQVYVRSEITKYLQSLPSNTPLAVFVLTSGLHIIQGFTSDLAELQAALNTSKGAAATQPSPLLPTDSKNSAEQTTIELMQMNNTAPVSCSHGNGRTRRLGHKQTHPHYFAGLPATRPLSLYNSRAQECHLVRRFISHRLFP